MDDGKRSWLIVGGVLMLNAVLWHLAIVSSIARNGALEASPGGWFFMPSLGILFVVNLGAVAFMVHHKSPPPRFLVLAELVVQIGYAMFYRRVHHTVARDVKWSAVIDVGASVWSVPVLLLAVAVGYGLGNRLGHRTGPRPTFVSGSAPE